MKANVDHLRTILERAGANWMGYGPSPEAVRGSSLVPASASEALSNDNDDAQETPADGQGEAASDKPVMIAEHFGAYEAEYAAIRQRVGVMAQPQRSVVRLTGADCQDFLNRLMTQNVAGMSLGQSCRAFQLGDKGRIVADTIIHRGESDTWLEMDRFDVPGLIELLDARLFVEDVTLEDWTDQRTALAVYGPAAQALLEQVDSSDQRPETSNLALAASKPGTHHVLMLASQPVTVYRRDELGVLGLHLLAQTDHGPRLLEALLEAAGFDSSTPDPQEDPQAAAEAAQRRRQSLRGRPIGWQAYNTARIEAGTAIFHIDFGPDSLPAEAGQAVVDEAVAFDKGCFLGQEIVARMRNLGHPKRVLVGLQVSGAAVPVAGTQVLDMPAAGVDAGPGESQVIGGVTSSTISPLLGNQPIALAMMKWAKHHEGTEVRLAIDGQFTAGRVTKPRFID